MKLYLIRHGTTAWNEARKIQGRTDIPLDALGEEIARITGEALLARGIRFRRVFSSPLQRALRTAELAAPGVPPQTDPRLRELSFGGFEGRSVEKMMADETCPFRWFRSDPLRYDEAMREYEETRPEEHFESLTALCARTGRFLQEVITPLILSEPADACVLISGHGALNSALMMNIMNRTSLHEFWGKGLQANCGIFVIDALPSASGGVVYQCDEECRIFYDPESLPRIPGLL